MLTKHTFYVIINPAKTKVNALRGVVHNVRRLLLILSLNFSFLIFKERRMERMEYVIIILFIILLSIVAIKK